VHLGQDDMPLSAARKILGNKKIFGKSTHNIRQAIEAQREGADYIGFGPMYKTKTKPHLSAIGLAQIAGLIKHIRIPFFALGGIGEDNIYGLKEKGMRRIAVSNAVMSAKDTAAAVKNLEKALL